jgi:hypothetical protein
LLFGTRFRFAKPRSAHIALQKANTLFAVLCGDGLRDSQTAMYIRTGLAPISDESAHNQGKKEKNLKNSYQVKQCSKKEKK